MRVTGSGAPFAIGLKKFRGFLKALLGSVSAGNAEAFRGVEIYS